MDRHLEMRWQHQQTGWDLGMISPPIKQYIDSIDDKNQRILIPGCGNAHEAVYLLEKDLQMSLLLISHPH